MIKTPCVETDWWLDQDGYGRKMIDGKKQFAHRYSYEQKHGPIPNGSCVLHECDNPPCINEEHLFLGSHQDNQKDKVSKVRQARGERHGRSRLSEEDAVSIMARLLTGRETRQEIAQTFRVGWSTVQHLWLLQTWAHVFLVSECLAEGAS